MHLFKWKMQPPSAGSSTNRNLLVKEKVEATLPDHSFLVTFDQVLLTYQDSLRLFDKTKITDSLGKYAIGRITATSCSAPLNARVLCVPTPEQSLLASAVIRNESELSKSVFLIPDEIQNPRDAFLCGRVGAIVRTVHSLRLEIGASILFFENTAFARELYNYALHYFSHRIRPCFIEAPNRSEFPQDSAFKHLSLPHDKLLSSVRQMTSGKMAKACIWDADSPFDLKEVIPCLAPESTIFIYRNWSNSDKMPDLSAYRPLLNKNKISIVLLEDDPAYYAEALSQISKRKIYDYQPRSFDRESRYFVHEEEYSIPSSKLISALDDLHSSGNEGSPLLSAIHADALIVDLSDLK